MKMQSNRHMTINLCTKKVSYPIIFALDIAAIPFIKMRSNSNSFATDAAVASELAGMHSYDIGLHQKSLSFFMHSIKCYKKWGALAIAQVSDLLAVGVIISLVKTDDNFIQSFIHSGLKVSSRINLVLVLLSSELGMIFWHQFLHQKEVLRRD